MLPLFQIIFFFFFCSLNVEAFDCLRFSGEFSLLLLLEKHAPRKLKRFIGRECIFFFIYKFTINEQASYKGTCWLNLIRFSPNTNRLRTRCEYRLPSLDPKNFRRPAERKSQAAESKRISVASKCAFWNRRFDAGVLRARAIPRYF